MCTKNPCAARHASRDSARVGRCQLGLVGARSVKRASRQTSPLHCRARRRRRRLTNTPITRRTPYAVSPSPVACLSPFVCSVSSLCRVCRCASAEVGADAPPHRSLLLPRHAEQKTPTRRHHDERGKKRSGLCAGEGHVCCASSPPFSPPFFLVFLRVRVRSGRVGPHCAASSAASCSQHSARHAHRRQDSCSHPRRPPTPDTRVAPPHDTRREHTHARLRWRDTMGTTSHPSTR